MTRWPLSRPRAASTPAQPVGVGEAAQVVDAGEVGAGDVEAARLGAGGQQQLVVVDDGCRRPRRTVLAVAVDGVRRSGRGAVRCRRRAYQAGSWTKTLSRSSLPSEIALGERGALVRVVAFVADQDHPAGEALRPQRLGRLRPGQPSSDDDECPMCVDHLMPPR